MTRRRHARRGWRITLGLVQLLCLTLAASCSSAPSAAPGVPAALLAGPGTALPDHLTVAAGSALIGAVYRGDAQGSWSAVVLVDGDALVVWRSYLEQFDASLNHFDIKNNAGCSRKAPPAGRTLCTASALVGGGPQRTVGLTMLSVSGDVTGRYLLRIGGSDEAGFVSPTANQSPKEGAALKSTPPQAAKSPLKPDRLFPGATGVYGGEWRLIQGTRLVAKYGPTDSKRGFDVLLHVLPGYDVSALADEYMNQPYYKDPVGSGSRTEGDVTYGSLQNQGGAGAYSQGLGYVDQPGDQQDYIFYSVHYET